MTPRTPAQEKKLDRMLAQAERKVRTMPGGAELLAAHLTRIFQKPIARQTVNRWFRVNRARRQEPGLTMGSAIIAWGKTK